MTNTTRRTIAGIAVCLLAAAVLLFVNKNKKASMDTPTLAFLTYEVDGGWGYDITIDSTTYIHQPFAPAVEGAKPFPTQFQAEEAARLVLNKMMNGELPGLTAEEVTSILNRQPSL